MRLEDGRATGVLGLAFIAPVFKFQALPCMLFADTVDVAGQLSPRAVYLAVGKPLDFAGRFRVAAYVLL